MIMIVSTLIHLTNIKTLAKLTSQLRTCSYGKRVSALKGIYTALILIYIYCCLADLCAIDLWTCLLTFKGYKQRIWIFFIYLLLDWFIIQTITPSTSTKSAFSKWRTVNLPRLSMPLSFASKNTQPIKVYRLNFRPRKSASTWRT